MFCVAFASTSAYLDVAVQNQLCLLAFVEIATTQFAHLVHLSFFAIIEFIKRTLFLTCHRSQLSIVVVVITVARIPRCYDM
jgi:hypothetical protein